MRKEQTNSVWAVAIAALALVLSAPAAWAAQNQSNPVGQAQAGQLNSKDYNFLVQAARIDMEEVQAGELAQKRATSQAVRDFGEHMINDHSKINKGLKEIATQKGTAVPTQLSQEQNSTLQKLGGLSGADFDKTFAQDMVKGHTHAVKDFEEASKDLSDTDLRAWSQTTLPLLQEHLRMAKNMETVVKNET